MKTQSRLIFLAHSGTKTLGCAILAVRELLGRFGGYQLTMYEDRAVMNHETKIMLGRILLFAIAIFPFAGMAWMAFYVN